MGLVHLVAGSCSQSNIGVFGTQFTSACGTYSAVNGDTCCNGTDPLDLTCPLCVAIRQGRMLATLNPQGLS